MGFFLPDAPTALPISARAGGRKAPRQLDPNARGCDACGLRNEWHRMSTPCMPMRGEGDLLILGEQPGAEDDRNGRPFSAAADRALERCIPGHARERLRWGHAVRCHSGRDALPLEAHACGLHLEADVAGVKAILGVGAVPLRNFIAPADSVVQRIHGTRFPVQIGAQVLWYYPILSPGYVERLGGERGPAFAVFRADIRQFFKQVDRWPAPCIEPISSADVLLPRTEEEARSLLARMRDPLGTDIETSKLRPYEYDAQIITAAFSDGKLTMAFPVDHPEGATNWGIALLLETIATRPWIAHNAAFEYAWFAYFGRKLLDDPFFVPAAFEDTMAQVRLYHERETLLNLSLASRIHLGVDLKTLTQVDAKRIMSFPLAEVLPYNGLDALGSALIWRKLAKQVKPVPYQRLLKTVQSTAEMELAGLPVDEAKAHEAAALWEGRAIAAQAQSRTLYEVRQFEQQRQKEFNIGSAIDVGTALVEYGKIALPRTAKQYATDDATLTQHAADNPLARNVLDYRHAVKMKSTYVDPILACLGRYPDGLLHPTYSALLTATLRLSSADPNIQNFPKRSKEGRALRAMIIAHIERILGVRLILASFDFKQLEARIIGAASQDNVLCKSIIHGDDIHGEWRDNILRVYPDYMERLAQKSGETDEKAILKVGRDVIKTDFVFASFYGAIARSVAERTNIPLPIVQQVLAEFWDTFRGVRNWIKGQRRGYAESGSTHTLTGLTRHAILHGNEPINNPIQGTAAAIVLEAQNEMCALSLAERDPFLMPRINIHDDLTFLLPDDGRLYAYIDRIGKAMVRCRFDWQIIPLSVSCSVGYDWASLEEVASFTGDYRR